jgi:hypothetical protein
MDPASDFARDVSSPGRRRAHLHERPLGALGDVVLGIERRRGVTARRGKHCSLQPETNRTATLNPEPRLRQPEPQIAGGCERRCANRCDRHRIQRADEGRFLTDEQMCAGPAHDRARRAKSQQRKCASAARGHLTAVKIDIDVAGKRAAHHVGRGDHDTELRLSNGHSGAAARCRDIRCRELRVVDVVHATAVVKRVHENAAVELQLHA